MTKHQAYMLSVVVPVYNEGQGLPEFHQSLIKVLDSPDLSSYEVIYCDDGSTDNTSNLIETWHSDNPRVKLLKLSRNFGKENALSAGIEVAHGNAIITIDGDGQHPVSLIPEFVDAWKSGAKVVIGLREGDSSEEWLKKGGSRLFYKAFNLITGQELLAGSTDYRLIDRVVQQAFISLRETERITRGLIDWIGFERQYIKFKANPRKSDTPGYSFKKLTRLAANSFVSMSPKPLYIFGYLGVLITTVSLVVGIVVFIEQLILGDPLGWKFTGTALLAIVLVFLVGIVLLSQGILSLYISHIHSQSKQRPLFIIDYENSEGISKETMT